MVCNCTSNVCTCSLWYSKNFMHIHCHLANKVMANYCCCAIFSMGKSIQKILYTIRHFESYNDNENRYQENFFFTSCLVECSSTNLECKIFLKCNYLKWSEIAKKGTNEVQRPLTRRNPKRHIPLVSLLLCRKMVAVHPFVWALGLRLWSVRQ